MSEGKHSDSGAALAVHVSPHHKRPSLCCEDGGQVSEEDEEDLSISLRQQAKARSKKAAAYLTNGGNSNNNNSSESKHGGGAQAWGSQVETVGGLWMAQVSMCDNIFTPSNLHVPLGTTVVFTVAPEELSMIEYRIAIQCQDLSPTLRRGGSFSFLLCETGHFRAQDTEFSDMTCDISVFECAESEDMVRMALSAAEESRARAKDGSKTGLKGGLTRHDQRHSDPRDEDEDEHSHYKISNLELKTSPSSSSQHRLAGHTAWGNDMTTPDSLVEDQIHTHRTVVTLEDTGSDLDSNHDGSVVERDSRVDESLRIYFNNKRSTSE